MPEVLISKVSFCALFVASKAARGDGTEHILFGVLCLVCCEALL